MSAKENFFNAHWDLLSLAAAILVVVGVGAYFAADFTLSPEDASAQRRQMLSAAKPAHDGVSLLETDLLHGAMQGVRTPPRLRDVDVKHANFLSSERRIVCVGEGASAAKACGRPIPAASETCPFCGTKQPALVKIELDSDHDGLPNDWEVKFGLNATDATDASKDKDGDGFSNAEEYAASTDPTDPKSHPDYLDYLSVASSLKQTNLPFYLREANEIPDGKGGRTWRCTFQRLNARKYEDKTFSVKPGEAIKSGKIDSGWTLVKVTKKTVQVTVKGGGGMKTRKEVYEAELKRNSDDRRLVIRDGEKKISVEAQVDLVWQRGEKKPFSVAEGTKFDLQGEKYRVMKLKAVGDKCEVTLECVATKKQKTIQ